MKRCDWCGTKARTQTYLVKVKTRWRRNPLVLTCPFNVCPLPARCEAELRRGLAEALDLEMRA